MALAPLLVALASPAPRGIHGRSGSRRAFGLGLTTGLIYFVGTVYWTSGVMGQYGDIPVAVAMLLMVALSAYLALYPAAFTVVVHRCVARFGLPGLLVAPAAWVAIEFARDWLFTGFPWVLLGYSQVTVLPIAQAASLAGVYCLSALVVSASTALAWLVIDRSRARWRPAAAVALLVAGVATWGAVRIGDGALTRDGAAIRVGLIQGNVAQDKKWDRGRASAILQTYLDLSYGAVARGARLVIWPESALPFYFEEDPLAGDAVRRLAAGTGSWVLFGSDQLERGAPAKYYNSAFLLDRHGQVAAVYRKIHLVPFGEYVPVKRLLFFAGPLVEAVGEFSAGDRMVILPIGGHKTSTAICYEVVYPELAGEAVRQGSELLTTITNDAWFGRSSAPWQHFEMAAMRAIEQGRYLVRSANTGLSGIVDPYGHVLERSALFEPAAIVGDVRFLTGRTVYGRTGDVFAWASVAATLGALLATFRRAIV